MRTKKEQNGREGAQAAWWHVDQRSMQARIRSRRSGPCAPSPRTGWARGPSVRRSREGPGLSASFSSPARTVHRRRGRTGTVYRAPVRLCRWRSFSPHYGSPMRPIEQFFSILSDRPVFFTGTIPPGSRGGSPLAPRPRAVKVWQPKFRPGAHRETSMLALPAPPTVTPTASRYPVPGHRPSVARESGPRAVEATP